MQTITGTRHEYGTANVYVESTETLSLTSRAAGTPQTGFPETYFVEDEDDWGYRNRVTVRLRPVRKDGTPADRTVKCDIAKADVPADVWAALVQMRPDLTR
jgi:hypothetical protein